MLKVHCAGCNAPYEVDPKRIPKAGMKMRCPACDTTFMVTPDGAAAPPAPPAPPPPPVPKPAEDPFGTEMPTLGGLDLDLPMPSRNKMGGGDMFADLPAPKGTAAHAASDLELDLPAPKGKAPRTADELDLELDLPAPKGAARPAFDDVDLPAPKAKGGGKVAPDFQADLPAPKSPAQGRPIAAPTPGPTGDAASGAGPRKSFSKPGIARSGQKPSDAQPGAAKPAAPAAPAAPEAPKRPLAGMPKDSLAIDPGPFFGGGDPLGGLDDPTGGGLDLPAPRAADFDLPAPKIQGNRPADADLPAPKGPGRAKHAPDRVDLPAAKGATDLPGLPKAKPRQDGVDLPAVKPAARAPADDGVDLPALRDDGVDLPALRDDGVDLPAVRDAGADLPAPKGQADLPAPKGQADLPAPKGQADLPMRKPPTGSDLASRLRAAGELPPDEPAAKPKASMPKDSLDIEAFKAMGGQLPAPFDLDDAAKAPQASAPEGSRTSAQLSQGLKLPSLDTGVKEVEPPPQAKPASLPSLQPAATADDLELELGEAPPPLELEGPSGSPDGGLDDLFGDPGGADLGTGGADSDPFGLGEPPAAGGSHEPLELGGSSGMSLDLDDDLPPKPPAPPPPPAPAALDAGGFDELGGLDAPPPTGAAVELDRADEPSGLTRKPRELGMTLDLDADEPPKPKLKVPGFVWILVAVVVFAGTGFGLGQTRYGLFGVYLIERFLPEAGDPKQVAADIEAAEKLAASDTYVDVRKSLRLLSDARMSAGLSLPLLSRSLLHEALFRLRFGPDNHSSQRAVAILSRLRERSHEGPTMHLAVAAELATQGKLAEAQAEADQALDASDPYVGLVRGEILLLRGQPGPAAEQFATAAKLGAGARATFGLARARKAAGDVEGAKTAIARTLELSPLHAGAHVRRGAWALDEGKLDEAEQDLLQAVGWREVDGDRIHASRLRRGEAWTLLGRLYEQRDYIGRALAAYERALNASPLVMEALLGSGRTLLQLSRPREALSRFGSALQANPPTTPLTEGGPIPLVEASVGAARALLRIDDFDKAIEYLKPLPAPLNEDAEVTLWLGHAYEQKGELETAEGYYRKSIEKDPSQFAGYLALAQMLFAQKRPEEAAQTLDAAKKQVEDGASVRHMLGQSELARNHIQAARDQFEAALKFEPNNLGALFGLAITQRREGELKEAAATLDKVESIDPKFPALALERGRIFEALGEYDSAVTVYEKALAKREGDIDLQLQLGAALVTAGKLDRAEELLSAVLKVRPTSAEAEHFIGRVLFGRKDSTQAVAHFERAVTLDVTNPVYHMYLAWASLESGNFAGALEAIDRSIARDDTLGDAHWIKGRIQLRMGLVKDAIESFTEALKLSPGRSEAYADMGDAYEQLRKLRSAVNAYEVAVERDPSRGDWWYRLGSLLLDRGKRSEALEALSEAVVLGDRMETKPAWLAEAHRIYADALHDKGDDERALSHYELYLELAPDNALDRDNVERNVERLKR